MATNAAWVTALTGMTITGTTRRYTYPPESVETADLPAWFVQLPGGEMPGWTVSCTNRNKTRSAQVIIVTEPVAQGTNSQNFGALPALMDALENALDALTVYNFMQYDLSAAATVEIAGIVYWAIVANVRGRDV